MAHAEGIENVPLNICREGFTRNAFDDLSGERDTVVGIGFDVAFGKETSGLVFGEPVAQRVGLPFP
jgi:adenine/guanine phosphoribosyltransferase-like PRPP-binding protein